MRVRMKKNRRILFFILLGLGKNKTPTENEEAFVEILHHRYIAFMKSLKYYILNCLASISLCLINFDTGKGLLENVIRFAAFARHRFIRAIDSAESREIMFDHK